MTRARRAYAAVFAAVGWFALAAQLYLIVRTVPRTAVGMAGAVVTFLSFFTILTNILVAVALTAAARAREWSTPSFFNRAPVATALASYITVVGVTYSVMLRRLWAPTGLQLIVDRLLHDVVPIAFVVFWFAFAPKAELKWRDSLPWLLYPLGYVFLVGIRGAIIHRYPYPFIDVEALGYARALLNAVLMALLFWGLGLAFVAIGRAINRRARV